MQIQTEPGLGPKNAAGGTLLETADRCLIQIVPTIQTQLNKITETELIWNPRFFPTLPLSTSKDLNTWLHPTSQALPHPARPCSWDDGTIVRCRPTAPPRLYVEPGRRGSLCFLFFLPWETTQSTTTSFNLDTLKSLLRDKSIWGDSEF